MADLAKQTAKQRAETFYMMEAMRRLEWDLHNTIEMTGHIPPEWHDIAMNPGRAKGRRVCVVLDEDVLRFFRSMGQGYGPRLNAVLKSYMHARLAGVIKGPETINHFKHRAEVHSGPKPEWGSLAAEFGEEWEDAPGEETDEMRMARVRARLRQKLAERDGA